MSFQIVVDDLRGAEVQALLREHLQNMQALSPADSVHALDLSQLRAPEVTFWTVWRDGQLMGCGALKALDATHAEIKSMRTPQHLRRQGAARALLEHMVQEAQRSNYARLSLETGTPAPFQAARTLYESFGFVYCGPFGDYTEDPYSVFMRLDLRPKAQALANP